MPEVSVPEGLLPLEEALVDCHGGRPGGALGLLFDHGESLEVDPSWFFRSAAEMDAVDRRALELARGRVLDVGAGAGAHALALQARGHPVSALELLPGAARILAERGVRDVRLESVWDHRPDRPYDTVLLLMNGTGVAGTLSRLGPLLRRIHGLLAPGGVLLMDSTDPGPVDPGDGRHPGELQIQLEYRGRKGPPFPHLYVGPGTLEALAREAGLEARTVLRAEDGRYLARCRRALNP
ncbi:MAG: methyltransferase domain-containing protein [Gemmatimonadota bacterium]|jgi:SAM-dependent methyltransferase